MMALEREVGSERGRRAHVSNPPCCLRAIPLNQHNEFTVLMQGYKGSIGSTLTCKTWVGALQNVTYCGATRRCEKNVSPESCFNQNGHFGPSCSCHTAKVLQDFTMYHLIFTIPELKVCASTTDSLLASGRSKHEGKCVVTLRTWPALNKLRESAQYMWHCRPPVGPRGAFLTEIWGKWYFTCQRHGFQDACHSSRDYQSFVWYSVQTTAHKSSADTPQPGLIF